MTLPGKIVYLWAEYLRYGFCAPARPELHIHDALAAFLCGLGTREGTQLAQLFDDSGEAAGAAVVAAITRLSECDDIDLSAYVTPGAVVIPVALAYGQECSEEAFLSAVEAGYTAGCILGTGINGEKAAPRIWPTLLAAPMMAAATLAVLKQFDTAAVADAMALSLAGAGGRVGQPPGFPPARWLALHDAVRKGIDAVHAVEAGFHGDHALPDADWFRCQAGHEHIDLRVIGGSDELADCLGFRVGFKPFPVARQTLNAVFGFQQMLEEGIDPDSIDAVHVSVPEQFLEPVTRPPSHNERASLLSNLGLQIACAALSPGKLFDPERKGDLAPLLKFAERVTVDASRRDPKWGDYPVKLVVQCGGAKFHKFVRGLPYDDSTRGEIDELLENKWRRLLTGEVRRDFFENVVSAGTDSHAVLWRWVKQRLDMAAQARD